MGIEFEWDPGKAASNQKKHGVSFEEAATVFADPLALIFDDDIGSGREQREIILGHTMNNRFLLVCFVERAETLRIISAREATKREQRDYEEEPKR